MNPRTAAEDPGSFFFGIYGDPWPYDEEEDLAGDGRINIFDLVRTIKFCLGFDLPAPIELVAADIPTGFDDCQAPDGVINIFDILIPQSLNLEIIRLPSKKIRLPLVKIRNVYIK